jgi:hypothetical protein
MSSGELSWRHIEKLDALTRLFLLYPSGGPLWLNHLRNPVVDDLAQADLMVVADMPHRTEEAARAGRPAGDARDRGRFAPAAAGAGFGRDLSAQRRDPAGSGLDRAALC